MNDKAILLRRLEAEPENTIVQWMLVDWLQEFEDRTYSEALRLVNTVCELARQCRTIADVATMMSEVKWVRTFVLDMVSARFNGELPDSWQLLVIGGGEPPTIPQEHARPRGRGRTVYVPVGAEWILAAVNHERAVQRQRRKDRKRINSIPQPRY